MNTYKTYCTCSLLLVLRDSIDPFRLRISWVSSPCPSVPPFKPWCRALWGGTEDPPTALLLGFRVLQIEMTWLWLSLILGENLKDLKGCVHALHEDAYRRGSREKICPGFPTRMSWKSVQTLATGTCLFLWCGKWPFKSQPNTKKLPDDIKLTDTIGRGLPKLFAKSGRQLIWWTPHAEKLHMNFLQPGGRAWFLLIHPMT